MLTPTAEQSAIISATRDSAASLMISAYAGTAKTTTLEMLAQELPPGNATLALAFNVKIKKELESRLPKHITVKTMNGLGHSAWGRAISRKLTLETNKLGNALNAQAKEMGEKLSRDDWSDARTLIVAARHAGISPKGTPGRSLLPDAEETWRDLADECDVSPDFIPLARRVLSTMVKQSYQGLIDFDDQIYMSALYGGRFDQYHTVLVDEAQDLSLMNHLMVGKCRPARLIVCGDPKQSLYAFRGAATDSMGKMRNLMPDWIDLPLTLTFRCPKAVVARQQSHAPGYRAAESNAEGEVLDWRGSEWTPPHGRVAVLCRNNAPLVSCAFKLLRQGISVSMLGRDLGKGLIKMLKDLKLPDNTPLHTTLESLTNWYESQRQLLLATGKDSKLSRLSDRYESIIAIAEPLSSGTLSDLSSAITKLFFAENGRVEFASIHRAKGLEWDAVVHLDPFLLPSKFATTPEALAQEDNALYVCETRTKNILILANSKELK